MGRASKWFKGLFGLKNSDPDSKLLSRKKKWNFAKPHKEKHDHNSAHAVVEDDDDPSKRAVAVATATAAVAEAAVKAAQAAAVVVKLTSSSGRNSVAVGRCGAVDTPACARKIRGGCGSRKERAAVMIQSHFRAYLSRRALRALKGLVKIQALTRGHLVRKRTAEYLRRMQALVRVQARARAGRFLISESPHSILKSFHANYQGPATPDKFEHAIRTKSMKHEQFKMLKRNGSRSREGDRFSEQRHDRVDEEREDKILEVDTGKPCMTPQGKTALMIGSQCCLGSDQNVWIPSAEVQSLCPPTLDEENSFYTADNSPQFYSTSSICGSSSKRGGVFTPASKSDGSRSCLSGHSDHPNYMAYTESSKAKARSLSAPKQRLQYERSSSAKRYSMQGFNDHPKPNPAQRNYSLHADFASKAYPGSGRLDRLGMPVRGDVIGFSGGYRHRW